VIGSGSLDRRGALMRVLVVNAGSSSVKLRLLDDHDEVEAEHDVDRWDAVSEANELTAVVGAMRGFDAVGHRVVHGGNTFRSATRIDAGVERVLLELTPLAPLHQPRAVAGIRMLSELRPDVAQVACFDTAFHASMPEPASTYALPREWQERWGLRRFGFHGLSHAYATRRAAELLGRSDDPALRVVTCHLGAGASLCATLGGRSIDTTMGWTPLEGLVMATRSGTVDPGLVLWLIQQGGLEAGEVTRALESESGLAGISGIAGGDMRDVLAARASGDEAATLAFEVYVHRLRRELGGMIAVLGGLDALVFTGGVGENSPEVRAAAREIGGISADVQTLVVPSREDLEIASQVRMVLQRP
jgi:acetate kinase